MNRRKFLASIAASAAVPMVSAEKKDETMKVIVSEPPVARWPESGLVQGSVSLTQMTAREYMGWRKEARRYQMNGEPL